MPLFSRSQPFKTLVFATDLHGSTLALRKLITAAKRYDAQFVVIGGDITGKAIVPVYRQDGSWRAKLFDSRQEATTDNERNELFKRIEDVGLYPYELEHGEAAQLEQDETKVDSLFLKLMRDRLLSWADLLQEHFASTAARCFWIPGNDDRHELDDVFDNADFVTNVDNRVVEMDDDHEIAGLAETRMTPWRCERDEEEDQLETRIEKTMSGLRAPNRAVLNFHSPPRDTKIDQCPEIDENLEIVRRGGQVVMTSAGSAALRRAIEKYQPLLGLHGHVHESRGTDRIGRTLVVNPGSEYAEGILRATVVNLERDRVKGVLQFSG